MKPLIVLIATFSLALLGTLLFNQRIDFIFSGKLAMSVMLIFTASGHFAFKKGMAMMIPKPIPFKLQLVFITGIIEILAAIGLFIPKIQLLTAWLLIIFFLLILPANIYASVKRIDYQKGTFDGKGIGYLWFRIPLQILYIAWIYFFIIAHW